MMTDDQRRRYESMRQLAREELERVDKDLQEEVARARQRIEELQQVKKAVMQIHEGACSLLGVKSLIEMKDYGLAELERKL